jgi:hypothetical protein
MYEVNYLSSSELTLTVSERILGMLVRDSVCVVGTFEGVSPALHVAYETP